MKLCGFLRGRCTNPRVCGLVTGPWPSSEEWTRLRGEARQCRYRVSSVKEWYRAITRQRKRRHWKGADEHLELMKGEPVD